MVFSQFYLGNLKATEQFGWNIGQIVQGQTLIALCGNIGSGKTTLVQAIAKGLQVEELVTSPTFVMINEYYSGRLPLCHIDCYRFLDLSEQRQGSADLEDLSKQQAITFDFLSAQLNEILNTEAVVIIEWANIIANQFGQNLEDLSENGYLSLELMVDPNNDQARLAKLKAIGQKNQSTVKEQSVFRFSQDLCKMSKELLAEKML
jgi:tRNA threonylcarbamoyl adenosine modification protein YjeE